MMKAIIWTRLEWFAAILLTLVILVLLLTRVEHAGALWRDECASVQLAEMLRISDVVNNFQRESFPLPFPLLLRSYAAAFGTSDHAFRAFGFAVGLALLAVLWINARTLRSGPPLLAMSLLGLNTTFLVWGTGIRGYGIGSVLILLAFGMIARFLVAPTVPQAVLALIACVVSVQFLLYNSVLLAAMTAAGLIVCLARKDFRTAGTLVLIAGISACSVLPYLGPFRYESESSVVFQGPVDFAWFSQQLTIALGSPFPFIAVIWGILVFGLIGGAVVRLILQQSRNPSPESDQLLFGLLALGFALPFYFVFLKIVSYRTREWYYLALIAILAGALDLLAAQLVRIPWVRIMRLVVVCFAIIGFSWAAWPKVIERQTNMDVLARNLAERARPDDVIVVNPWFLGISFNRYYRGSAPWVTCPMMEDHHLHRFDLLKEKLAAPNPIDDLLARIRSTLQSGHSVWFVGDVKILPPDAHAIVLPPAPHSEFGWSGDAYSETWSQQLGDLVRSHVQNWERMPEIKSIDLVPIDQPINELEKVPVAIAHGWRD